MRAHALRRIGATALCLMMGTTTINCAPHGEVAAQDEAEPEAAWTMSAPPRCSGAARSARTSMSVTDAEDEGALDAALDLARGVLALESYEQPRLCHARLAERLRVQYEIDYRNVGACGVDEVVVGHARGYNAMMHRHIAAQHGAVVEATAREVGCLREG
jgi:hypothetical protein